MNSSSASIEMLELIASLRESTAAGMTQEDLIQAMRAAGLNQIACIKMLRDISGISLGDAKEAVHYSHAWKDRRTSNEALHEAAFEAAKELGFVEVSS